MPRVGSTDTLSSTSNNLGLGSGNSAVDGVNAALALVDTKHETMTQSSDPSSLVGSLTEGDLTKLFGWPLLLVAPLASSKPRICSAVDSHASLSISKLEAVFYICVFHGAFVFR